MESSRGSSGFDSPYPRIFCTYQVSAEHSHRQYMASDTVFIEKLGLSVNIGRDRWGASKAQPLFISVYLHLTPNGYLTRAGESDDVRDSIHYGHLTKAVTRLVEERKEFNGIGPLVDAVAQAAFNMAGSSLGEVRIVVELPKMVLLAQGGMIVETTIGQGMGKRTKVYVKDMGFNVIVGVNEPERETKQRVVVNLEVVERENTESKVDYSEVVKRLAKDIEHMEYLTLEKMVWEITRAACLLLGEQVVETVTVRVQKLSALSFAQSSGVEMTRRVSDFR
ncbi:hypothetical protein AMATHDRAFT_8571 [Amanita thiersii Skay4041]|uniref:dihydroneopterin aldolase n=1 Tax=Amanita thiersii Skay4041 TaxID=703135 RepID=A0A2A9N9C9_9AGAR|nr:hypothetical protein AMATHDRAFT_8571 [Amanita thiersii Skay4041]